MLQTKIVMNGTSRDFYLPAVLHEVLPHGVEVPVLRVREEVRVVAALAQLHDDVEDRGPAHVRTVHGIDVAHQHPLVHLPLDFRHA